MFASIRNDFNLNLAVMAPTDISRAATVHPRDFIDPIFKFKVTIMLASPILWSNIARYCKKNNIKLDTLQFCMSGGAPIPLKLHKEVSEILNEGVGLFAGTMIFLKQKINGN